MVNIQTAVSIARTCDDRKNVKYNLPVVSPLTEIDPYHPSLGLLRLKPQTLRYFGIGVCHEPPLSGRIVVPVGNEKSRLVGYITRSSKNPDANWEFPTQWCQQGIRHGFDPTRLLYHSYPQNEGLAQVVVVPHFSDVWTLWERGVHHVVGILGTRVSRHQYDAIIAMVAQGGRVIVVSNSENPIRYQVRYIARRRACLHIDLPICHQETYDLTEQLATVCGHSGIVISP